MKKCRDCEFCFPHNMLGYVCADAFYGEGILDSLDVEKECYSEGINVFIDSLRKDEKHYIISKKLSQLNIDGRKRIQIQDQEGKVISINFKNACKIFSDIKVLKYVFENFYIVDTVFEKALFRGSSFLIIKTSNKKTIKLEH